jgi:hypothetical protein
MHHLPGGPDRRNPMDRVDSEFLEQGSILILRRKASGMAFNMNRHPLWTRVPLSTGA